MTLKQICAYCNAPSLAKRLQGFYIGSTDQVKLWECRKCGGIWSSKTLTLKKTGGES
jgi:Zn-finger protein